MRVGALRQVVPATLAGAFELVARGTDCEGAELQLEVVPARVSCSECAFEWTPLEPDFRCQQCGGPAVIVAGRELEVESIEVEDHPP